MVDVGRQNAGRSQRRVECQQMMITCGFFHVMADPSYSPSRVRHFRLAEHFVRFYIQMVRSTIIVRASDALPLAASVDDEQVGVIRWT